MGHRNQKPQRGIWKNKGSIDDPDVKVLDFSYTSDVLAQLVVDAWATPALKQKLLNQTIKRSSKQSWRTGGSF